MRDLRQRRLIPLIGLMAVLTLLFAACAAPAAAPSTGAEPAATAAEGAAAPAASSALPAEPGRGTDGSLSLVYWQEISIMNPYLSTGTKDFHAASLVLESLVEVKPDGTIIPTLAEDVPTLANGGISEDLTTITYKLKPGVVWSDGTPLTADDVVFSWQYCTTPETGCASAQTFAGVSSVEDKAASKRGFLDGHFLIAMPGMKDDRFARSVIYICAHSEEGAMGLIINQAQQMLFPDLLVQLGILDEKEAIRLPDSARNFVVRNGGPVDRSRGFVLHSDDYRVESSLPVSQDICLTATIDILRAISKGRGPRQALMALGYSGWGAGQLEREIQENGWLTCPALPDLLFDADMDRKYDRVIASLGINLAHLSPTAGHA